MYSSRKLFTLDQLISRDYPWMRFSRDSVVKSTALISSYELQHLETKLLSQASPIRPDCQQWLYQQLAIYYSHNKINSDKAIYYSKLSELSSQNRRERANAVLLQLDAALTDPTRNAQMLFDLSPIQFLSPVDSAYYQSRRLEYFVRYDRQLKNQNVNRRSMIELDREVFQVAIQNCQALKGRVAYTEAEDINLSLARCYVAWSNYILDSESIQGSHIDRVNAYLQSAEFNLERVSHDSLSYRFLKIQYLLSRAKFKFANGGPISPDSPSHAEDINLACHQINGLEDEESPNVSFVTPLWLDFLETLIYTKNFEFALNIANFLYDNIECYSVMTNCLLKHIDSLKLAVALQKHNLPESRLNAAIENYDKQSNYVQSLLDDEILRNRVKVKEIYTPRHPSLQLLANRWSRPTLFSSASHSGEQSGLASPDESTQRFRVPKLLSMYGR